MKFSMKKVTVLLADGFEEIEALTVVDLLRRAKVYVDTVSITDDYTVRGAHDRASGWNAGNNESERR